MLIINFSAKKLLQKTKNILDFNSYLLPFFCFLKERSWRILFLLQKA